MDTTEEKKANGPETILPFDTHERVQEYLAVGFTLEQAELFVEHATKDYRTMMANVATKADLTNLKVELEGLIAKQISKQTTKQTAIQATILVVILALFRASFSLPL